MERRRKAHYLPESQLLAFVCTCLSDGGEGAMLRQDQCCVTKKAETFFTQRAFLHLSVHVSGACALQVVFS